jgi:hypothetical protein
MQTGQGRAFQDGSLGAVGGQPPPGPPNPVSYLRSCSVNVLREAEGDLSDATPGNVDELIRALSQGNAARFMDRKLQACGRGALDRIALQAKRGAAAGRGAAQAAARAAARARRPRVRSFRGLGALDPNTAAMKAGTECMRGVLREFRGDLAQLTPATVQWDARSMAAGKMHWWGPKMQRCAQAAARAKTEARYAARYGRGTSGLGFISFSGEMLMGLALGGLGAFAYYKFVK